MSVFGGWRKCVECDVLWDSEHLSDNCWNCGKPGERSFGPRMSSDGCGHWIADRNDPQENDSAA